MDCCATPVVIVVGWPLMKFCFLLAASPAVVELIIDAANSKGPPFVLPKFPAIAPPTPPLSDKPNIPFYESVKAHTAIFDYCPSPFPFIPCEKLNSTNARKTTEGTFCPQAGKCIYLRDKVGHTPITNFIDGWAIGFDQEWSFCTTEGTPCDDMDSDLARNSLSGIFFPTAEGLYSIYAVNVSTTDLYHPKIKVPEIPQLPKLPARQADIESTDLIPRNKKRYWFVLALIVLTTVILLHEIALAIWFLNIYFRKPGRYENWIKLQYSSLCLHGVMTIMYIALLVTAFIPEEKILMWLIVYFAVELLTTIRAGWLLLATQKQIIPPDA